MRRSTLFLILLLVVGVGLFVALVMVPQIRQIRRAEANGQAGANVLVGTWRIDVDATLGNWATHPRYAKALALLPPSRIELMKSRVRNMAGGDPYIQITADKVISSYKGVPVYMTYAIVAVSDQVLIADCITDKEGIAFKMTMTVADDRLEMFNGAVPGGMDLAVIFNRVR
jgi:hypothetical protein